MTESISIDRGLKALWPSLRQDDLHQMTARKGNSHPLTCSSESNIDRLTGVHRMRECRYLSCSPVLEGDGLDPTIEKCVRSLPADRARRSI